jgi:hypothetical protein
MPLIVALLIAATALAACGSTKTVTGAKAVVSKPTTTSGTLGRAACLKLRAVDRRGGVTQSVIAAEIKAGHSDVGLDEIECESIGIDIAAKTTQPAGAALLAADRKSRAACLSLKKADDAAGVSAALIASSVHRYGTYCEQFGVNLGAASAVAVAKPQTFTGTGSENIGTVKVPVQSTLHWLCSTCSQDNFQIFNSVTDASDIGVNGLKQTAGKTVVDAGTYTDVQINTEGQKWTIKITSDD